MSLFFKASDFLFRNASFLLTFLLMAEGLNFFLTTSGEVELTLVSREKEKSEPMSREKVNGVPWLVSAWQNSRHLVTKVELPTLIVAGVIITG